MTLTRTHATDDLRSSDERGTDLSAMISSSQGATHERPGSAPTSGTCRLWLGVALGLMSFVVTGSPAMADLRICNKTTSRIGIAVGYKDTDAWTTEGWWNLPASSCETLLAGTLVSRYYYLYAIDYDRGGEWSGRSFMCTQEKTFTIKGIEDCLKRGFERTGFFEIDTGDQRNWTVQLTEPGRAGASSNLGDKTGTP